ncbi:hypothetical protein PSHT_06782 [Puccinia striiformis]|uniref:ABC-2 type transporter transmembrane domain-containing protein n=1 Tax=Puccinia striiformis TaxID=27350 RepID=A0A2S4W3Q7_9BASI|nr:hypothetical protein PSHT_06782 [Puccinia striiformis]
MAPLKTHHSRLAICSLRQLEAQRQQPPSTSNVSVREILSPIMAPVPLPHQLSPDQSVTAGNSTTHPDVMKGLCQDDDDRHEPRDPSGEFLNQDAVDVAEAERNFSELSRQLNHASAHTDDLSKELTYATPFSYQFKVVMNRTNLSFLRNANYEATRVFNHVAVALITGLTYMNLPPNVAGVQSRVFTIFQLIVLLPLIMAQVEPAFIFARQIYLRESSAKMYTPITFGISQSVAEMPYSLCCAVGFFVIWYYLPNLQGGGVIVQVVVAVELFAVTGGQAVAAVSPSLFVAAKINPVLVLVFALFCGVTVPTPNIPKFWRNCKSISTCTTFNKPAFTPDALRLGMYNLNPLTRVISGLVANEMHGLKVTCAPEEYAVFQPPSGQTCIQWAGAFIQRSGGYLLDPTATSRYQYCESRIFQLSALSLITGAETLGSCVLLYAPIW